MILEERGYHVDCLDDLWEANSLAPFATQESWDNSGLLVGDPDAGVHTALVVLDITPEAVQEARKSGQS